ncbi:MAG: arylamine N-acetyltransferase [Myxococcales bacterium]|nr:MAG: arylamine N-acetyltransferase [Myxococcales bacterium]
MNTDSFSIDAYLKRIGLSALPTATSAGLKSIVSAQACSITFENLDVLAGEAIRLDQSAIITKILHQGRGGYCFELNGLLALALQTAGFQLSRALARVTYKRSEPGPFTHMVLLVESEGKEWLVDAGFGGPGLIEPVLLEESDTIVQRGARFRLFKDNTGDFHLQRKIENEWLGLYIISSRAILPIDIEVANHFVSTWERSPFRSMFMVARPNGDMLSTLQGQEFLVLDSQLRVKTKSAIESAEHLRTLMLSVFDVPISEKLAAKVWLRIRSGP